MEEEERAEVDGEADGGEADGEAGAVGEAMLVEAVPNGADDAAGAEVTETGEGWAAAEEEEERPPAKKAKVKEEGDGRRAATAARRREDADYVDESQSEEGEGGGRRGGRGGGARRRRVDSDRRVSRLPRRAHAAAAVPARRAQLAAAELRALAQRDLG